MDQENMIIAISEDGQEKEFTRHMWHLMPEHKYGNKLKAEVPESVKAEMVKQTPEVPESVKVEPVDPAAAALARAKAAKEQ